MPTGGLARPRGRRRAVARAAATAPATDCLTTSCAGAHLRRLPRPREVGAEGVVEQTAGLDPVATNGADADVQRLGGLLLGHPAEEAAFDDARQPLVEAGEVVERLVELEQRLGLIDGGREALVERDDAVRPTALLGGAAPRAVDEDVAHCHRRDAQ